MVGGSASSAWNGRGLKRRHLVPYLYTLPILLLLGVFVYLPMAMNFQFMLQKFTVFSPLRQWVGLDNIRTLFSDPVIRTALRNNIWYCILSVLFQVFLSLIIASLLEDKLLRRISAPLRTVYFMPVLISMTVVAMLFTQVYAPKGLLNSFLNLFGGSIRTGWLGKPGSAIFATIAMSQWHSMGYTAMLFIVAIQKIPEDLYEAAEIDGAKRWQRFLHITVPQVREMVFVTMVTTVSGAFLVFNDVYILTVGGGPGNASVTLSVYMYNIAFTQDRMGYASAIAVLMLVICLGLALVQQRVLRSGEVD